MPERSFLSGTRFVLLIDNAPAASPAWFRGGDAIGDVVEVVDDSAPVVRKRLGGVHYSDLELACGADMSPGLLDWVRETLAHKFVRKSGAVIAADFEFKEVWRVDFTNALISEVTFPALDAAAKEPVKLGLKLAPELTRRVPGPGAGLKPLSSKSQKAWLASNFRLTIGDLDTSKVRKIDAIVVRIAAVEAAAGEHRDYIKVPGRIEFPNLVVTLADVSSDQWWAWHEDFVINGNNGPDRTREGALELLSTDGKPVMQITLRGLGIISLTSAPRAGADDVAQLRAEMYCEEISFA
jgi:T4-like virus tail tube protein gp19